MVVRGFFEYRADGDGWNDTFTVVDDDGMPFDLTHLKVFNGRGVTITIEINEALEAEADQPGPEPPLVYERLGLTRAAYARRRQKMRTP